MPENTGIVGDDPLIGVVGTLLLASRCLESEGVSDLVGVTHSTSVQTLVFLCYLQDDQSVSLHCEFFRIMHDILTNRQLLIVSRVGSVPDSVEFRLLTCQNCELINYIGFQLTFH